MTLLSVSRLRRRFGGVTAVKNCSFTVRENSITALIGPNGAGKTTVFNMITGLTQPDGGTITFRGEPLQDFAPHEIFHMGVGRTFQMLRIFPKLTVIENLMIAQPSQVEGVFDRILKRKRVRDEEKTKRQRALTYLKTVGLEKKQHWKAGDLSYGQQKLLDITRCIASEAELILLDEPVAGVNPRLREDIKRLLLRLKGQGRTILIIEHDMNFIMDLSDEVVVLDHGEEIAVGKPGQIRKNRRVIKAYLGE